MAAHSPWFLHPSTRALAHRLVSFLPPTRTLVPLSPTTTSARVSYHHKSTMCGIFAVLGCADCSQAQRARVLACSRRLKHRGPDWSGLYQHEGNFLAHQRLSVVSPLSGDQPLFNEDRTVVVVANGEIYNHKKIRKQFTGKHTFTTGSDCEVIIALYEEYGENFVDMLDGVFAFVLYDTRNKTFMAARDAIGVNPLYIGWGGDGSVWFSSEMKALNEDCVRFELFPPGHLYSSAAAEFRRWYNPRWFLEQVPAAPYDPLVLRAAFEKAVIKRLMTDAPFGVLLSGGLDSSLVASVTKRHLVETEAAKKFGTELHSFVVGLEGSPDLKAAREVADYLGTIHHEFYFTVQDGIDAIEEVIYHDETYDVTTIRASTPMFLMARKIKSLGVKMVLSGEGSDELLGGYLYFHFAPNKEEFHKETCRKVKALHQYDCLRANKATSAWGLEIRVPFLDKEFVDVAMGMDPEWKMYDKDLGRIEKWVMRKAFEDEENPYLPKVTQKRQFLKLFQIVCVVKSELTLVRCLCIRSIFSTGRRSSSVTALATAGSMASRPSLSSR
uniref:Asparagine synthetase [glutamine-hydrolyzing] n=1 Tax=Setaria italica TaxID=4555 RepID=K4A7Z3_SETIT